jgi:hypothetical protein
MLNELWYVDNSCPTNGISPDESLVGQLVEERLDVAVVVWQTLGLYEPGSIFESTVTVGECPQAGKEKPRQWFAICQDLVLEKPRLEIA